jgi:anti-anti-sigma factor
MNHDDLVEVCARGNRTVVSRIQGQINDCVQADRIARHLHGLIDDAEQDERGPLQTLNLDLEQVDRLSSSAVNHLIGVNRRARSCGIRLVLINVQQSVREVFALTRLERMFELSTSEFNPTAGLTD